MVQEKFPSERSSCIGILPIDKAREKSSFFYVPLLRRLTGQQSIGHAGTLDPQATGLLLLLLGRDYTSLSPRLMASTKEYLALIHLGITTDTYDGEGNFLSEQSFVPSLELLRSTLALFQGKTEQVPPMFSAKKQGGKKLYELARRGITLERTPCQVEMEISLLRYEYPEVELKVVCSKGTYIRSLAHDLGEKLGCGAYLKALRRTRSGLFSLDHCISGQRLADGLYTREELQPWLVTSLPT